MAYERLTLGLRRPDVALDRGDGASDGVNPVGGRESLRRGTRARVEDEAAAAASAGTADAAAEFETEW